MPRPAFLLLLLPLLAAMSNGQLVFMYWSKNCRGQATLNSFAASPNCISLPLGQGTTSGSVNAACNANGTVVELFAFTDGQCTQPAADANATVAPGDCVFLSNSSSVIITCTSTAQGVVVSLAALALAALAALRTAAP